MIKLTNKDYDLAGALLASKFARRIGLPQGNLWEPGIARKIAADLRNNEFDMDMVEDVWHFRFFGCYAEKVK